ncbi:CoA-binding protein [Pseudalkalibacillus sp. A8]|uniref:CoA-binding protein n=1 Tax=Pseudalkalibacillus sp. A8 TaxID=3382641 RepID=UPI0038B5629B
MIRHIAQGWRDISVSHKFTNQSNNGYIVPVEYLLKPKSIGIVGVSTKKGSAGLRVLNYLKNFQYEGNVHIVSRSQDDIEGISCLKSIDELPKGIDTVVLCVPQSAVVESVEACARRDAKSVMVFAAGFAEAGDEGILAQQKLREIYHETGVFVGGPNCMGLTNFVSPVPLTFAPGLKMPPVSAPGLGILTQSGGMMSSIRETSQARGIPLTYAISTGKEVVVGVEDYLDYLIEDQNTKSIAMYVEHIRRPQLFLSLAKKARKENKPIILLHPGKSNASREAAQSHTGSLAGDYTVIETLLKLRVCYW